MSILSTVFALMLMMFYNTMMMFFYWKNCWGSHAVTIRHNHSYSHVVRKSCWCAVCQQLRLIEVKQASQNKFDRHSYIFLRVCVHRVFALTTRCHASGPGGWWEICLRPPVSILFIELLTHWEMWLGQRESERQRESEWETERMRMSVGKLMKSSWR